jgi:hypothetical protein
MSFSVVRTYAQACAARLRSRCLMAPSVSSSRSAMMAGANGAGQRPGRAGPAPGERGGDLGQVVEPGDLILGHLGGCLAAEDEAAVLLALPVGEEQAALPDDDLPAGLGSPVAARPRAAGRPLAGEPEPEQEIAIRMLHVPAHQPELDLKEAGERGLPGA